MYLIARYEKTKRKHKEHGNCSDHFNNSNVMQLEDTKRDFQKDVELFGFNYALETRIKIEKIHLAYSVERKCNELLYKTNVELNKKLRQ